MFLGGGESPEKLEQINNVHFANELPTLRQQEEPDSMPTSPSNTPILEGTLIYRKDGRRLKTKNLRTYCVFDMSGEAGGSLEVGGMGSLKCYQFKGLTKKEASIAYACHAKLSHVQTLQSNSELCLDIPGHLPWIVIDIENDSTAFMIEIATSGLDTYEYFNVGASFDENEDDNDGNDRPEEEEQGIKMASTESLDSDDDGLFACWGGDSDDDDEEADDNAHEEEDDNEGNDEDDLKRRDRVQFDLTRAADANKSYVRYKFRVPSSNDNEKAMWIAAFKRVGRLSDESKKRKKLFGATTAVVNLTTSAGHRNSRMRSGNSSSLGVVDDDAEESKDKEYRVRPTYAYQHRWMTTSELTVEMNASSAVMHDTRLSPTIATSREIGVLKVEVLQCLGLPKLKGKDPNAVVYLVCGSYAFTTDVITQCQNPMWLRNMRRACSLPIYHGYATLMAGIFHDDGSKGSSSKDTFIGRIEVPISNLRPNSTYDVTLPLRQSTSVYTRTQLGAIRIRFCLQNYNEKQSILSYLPKRRNRVGRRVGCTTVACSDAKSFRNIALTVHGAHLKEKFAADIFKGHIRELTFVQVVIVQSGKQFFRDLTQWRNPIYSAYCFGGWMYCAYNDSAAFFPVYILGFALLHLIANYIHIARGVESFRRPSWLELLQALHNDTTKNSCIAAARETKNDTIVEENDSLSEFPFASMVGYKRLTVGESLNKSKEDSFNEGDQIGDDDELERVDSIPNQPETNKRKSKYPEQDINVKSGKKKDKNINDELKEVELKVQEATKFLFDYHTYYSIDDPNPPFGLKSNDRGTELDKLLSVGQYSVWNPILSNLTSQLVPILRILSIVLSIYRTIYSIWMWRDPILTFWVSCGIILLAALLSFFPWRVALFVSGILLLGPQNLVIRVVREKFQSNEGRSKRGRFLRAFRELLKDDEGNDTFTKDKNRKIDTSVQPIVHCHAPASNPLVEKVSNDIPQHIMVPYSPLFFNRFQDWPPADPKHSSVSSGELVFKSICPSSSVDIVRSGELELLKPLSVSLPTKEGGKKEDQDVLLSPGVTESSGDTKQQRSLRSKQFDSPPLVQASPNPTNNDATNTSPAEPIVEPKKKNRFTSRIAEKAVEKKNRFKTRMAAELQPALNKYKHQVAKQSIVENSNESTPGVDESSSLGEIPSVIETVSNSNNYDKESLETSDTSVLTNDFRNQEGSNKNSPPNDDDDDQAGNKFKEQTIYEEENSSQSSGQQSEQSIDICEDEEKQVIEDVVTASNDEQNNNEDEGEQVVEDTTAPPVPHVPSLAGSNASHSEDEKVEDESVKEEYDETALRPSPTLEAQLEQLLELKLELATAKAENDEYRMRLRDVEVQRDRYKEMYETQQSGVQKHKEKRSSMKNPINIKTSNASVAIRAMLHKSDQSKP